MLFRYVFEIDADILLCYNAIINTNERSTSMTYEKIIFMDIDGVLNSLDSFEKFQTFEVLDPDAVLLLKVVTERHRAELVISSVWRLPLEWLEMIRASFAQAGWNNPPIIGRTPSLKGDRGKEIQAWLDANPTESFVVIDDDAMDILPEQMPYFVQCNPEHGLMQEQIEGIDMIWDKKQGGQQGLSTPHR